MTTSYLRAAVYFCQKYKDDLKSGLFKESKADGAKPSCDSEEYGASDPAIDDEGATLQGQKINE